MSRVGKNEVKVPSSVQMTQNGQALTFKGNLGVQSYEVPDCLEIVKSADGISLQPKDLTTSVRILWGTTQRNLQNAVKGVDQGFTKNIDLVGVGYRASVSGQRLSLQLGFSHDVVYDLPEGVSAKCDKPTAIVLMAASKQKVGQIAAEIRTYRPPEPYKGKGVIREGDFVVRKEGKKK